MKKLILSASFAFALLTTSNTFAQQGFGTNQPNKSAAVDIVSSKRGLLIPRISIANLDQAAPVHQPAHSLFVFNTNATTGQGFYYWEKAIPTSDVDFSGKWVRFTSSINEKNVIVTAGDNVQVDPTTSPDGLTTTYKVGVQGGSKDGQVLVTKVDGATTTTEWVDPNDFVLDALTAGNAIGIALDVNGDIEIKFDGTLTEDTTIATSTHNLAITGLEDISATFDGDTHNIVVMGADGVLKITSPKSLIEDVIDNGDLEAKTLTGAGITVTAGTTAGDNTNVSVADVVLKDVTLGIADGAITNTKLAPGAVSQDKMTSYTTDNGTATPVPVGQVPVADGAGNVTYQNIATAIGEDLTTDGKIVIGNSASTDTTQKDAVLVATQLSIKENSLTATEIATGAVTSDEILDGTIQVADIKAPGTTTDSSTGGTANQVMVTDENGDVSWINQSDLGNQDSFDGTLPISVTPAPGTNETGGTDYTIAVATATGATLGVVKEVVTDPTVNINAAGELSVNLDNTILIGDVTGSLNATKVEAIQGTAVSATPPTATNNVLKYDGTAWTPAQLQGTDVAGKAITSTSLTVSADGATAALKDVTIDITPGTEGQILTTVGAAGAETTAWTTVNSLVEADNGLNKNDTTDKIHLGGALKEVTEIAASADHTLAISGLQPATEGATNKVVVSEGETGILRTVERVVEGTNANVVSNAGYSFYTPEVVLNITLPATGDVEVVFPAPASAVGQVINIKIANKTESHTGYLNVLDTYGSMPYQGWIVKSNGSAWVIVGRN